MDADLGPNTHANQQKPSSKPADTQSDTNKTLVTLTLYSDPSNKDMYGVEEAAIASSAQWKREWQPPR